MIPLKVECRCTRKKTHRIVVEASLLGRYAMWLCDSCYGKLENKYLLIDYDELEQEWAERDFRKFILKCNQETE